jgi:hypothetical protein
VDAQVAQNGADLPPLDEVDQGQRLPNEPLTHKERAELRVSLTRRNNERLMRHITSALEDLGHLKSDREIQQLVMSADNEWSRANMDLWVTGYLQHLLIACVIEKELKPKAQAYDEHRASEDDARKDYCEKNTAKVSDEDEDGRENEALRSFDNVENGSPVSREGGDSHEVGDEEIWYEDVGEDESKTVPETTFRAQIMYALTSGYKRN